MQSSLATSPVLASLFVSIKNRCHLDYSREFVHSVSQHIQHDRKCKSNWNKFYDKIRWNMFDSASVFISIASNVFLRSTGFGCYVTAAAVVLSFFISSGIRQISINRYVVVCCGTLDHTENVCLKFNEMAQYCLHFWWHWVTEPLFHFTTVACECVCLCDERVSAGMWAFIRRIVIKPINTF